MVKKFIISSVLFATAMGGKGDGPVASKMIVRPPTLLSDKAKRLKDGQIFFIISKGQGLMGAYASQIPKHTDRWDVVNYVRQLQKGGK